MKTKLILIMMLMAASTRLWAQDAAPRLVVWQKSGEKVYFDLAQMPETSFGDGVLTIKTNTTQVSYLLENVLRYTYENVKVTGIELMPNERSVEVDKEGGAVTFRNLKDGTVVGLYDLKGQLLEQRRAEGLHPVVISVRNRPRGVYIVKSDDETIKLMRP